MTLQDGLDLHFLNYQCVVDMGHQNYFFSKLKSTDYVWFGLFVFPFPLYILSAWQLECNWAGASPATSLVFSFPPQYFSACPFLDTHLLFSILKISDKY